MESELPGGVGYRTHAEPRCLLGDEPSWRIMAAGVKIRRFLFPRLTRGFFVRAAVVAAFAYLFFGHVCIPLRIKGSSMEPTYRDGRFNFCWRLRYILSEPKRHDVAVIRFAGKRVMLLKRVIAVEGEKVEFRHGKLFVDGKEIDEPYVRYPCNWDLPPRQVEKGHVYVMGDNRNTSMRYHGFGQTSIKRIVGAPLW